MMDLLQDIGGVATTSYWLPVLAWTLSAVAVAAIALRRNGVHARVTYVGALMLLLSLPLGFTVGRLTGGLVATSEVQDGMMELRTAGTGAMPTASQKDASLPSRATEAASPQDNDIANARTNNQTSIEVAPTANMNGRSTSGIANLSWVFVLVGFASIIVLLRVCTAAVRLAVQLMQVNRLRSLSPADDASVVAAFDKLRAAAGIRRHVRLAEGGNDVVPMTFGLIRPVVVVPANMLRESTALNIALAHELEHVRRNDYAIGLTVRLLTLPFAWHPLVARLIRRMEEARETLCDEHILADGRVSVADYANTLLRFVRGQTVPQLNPALTSSSQLKRRIEAMTKVIDGFQSVHAPSRRALVLVAALLLAVPLLVTACTSPQSSESNAAVNGVDDLPTLELQVNYLVHEISRVEAERDTMRAAMSELGAQEAARMRDDSYDILLQRRALLKEMLMEKLRERELARMDAAVGLAITG